MDSKKQLFGSVAALVANMIFGFSFIFSKAALSVSHPLVILAVRFTVAFIFLNLIFLIFGIKLRFKGKPKRNLILMGIMQPLLYFIFELYGLSMVSSALSGIILALVPVGVMLLAVPVLKEKPTFIQGLFIILSIISVSLISVISDNGSKSYFSGIILLVCAVMCASLFNVFSRGESERFSAYERTYIMFLLATVGFNLIAAVTLKGEYLPLIISSVKSPYFIVPIIYLSLVSSIGAFLLYNYATTVISAVRAASFSNIITVVTVLAGVIILKEKLTILEYILCAVIILSVWGVNAFTGEKKNG